MVEVKNPERLKTELGKLILFIDLVYLIFVFFRKILIVKISTICILYDMTCDYHII